MQSPKNPVGKSAGEGWKAGPVPPDTYGWGGVALKSNPKYGGFFFADFCGDHVKAMLSDGWAKVDPADIAYWNNSLSLPPG